MPKPPAPPPEARLLKLARLNHRPRLSVADAARLAGVSPSLWRQVEAGYSTPASGVRVPKVAPPGTLAIMARPLGITPADLAGAQRADAAAVLADLLREAPEPVAATGSLTLQPPAITADADVKARVYDLFKQVNEDIEAQVRAEIRRAKAAYRSVPLSEVPESGAEPGDTNLPGAAIPTFDVWERLVWDLAVAFTEEERTRRIVDARAAAAARTSRIRRAGLKKPDVLTA